MRKNKEQISNEENQFAHAPKIRARIIDGDKGLSFLPEVSAVRTRDVDANLLIMEDFMPIIGGIEGSIVFLTPNGEVRYDDIKGFYKHQQNEFTLIIQERINQDKKLAENLEEQKHEEKKKSARRKFGKKKGE